MMNSHGNINVKIREKDPKDKSNDDAIDKKDKTNNKTSENISVGQHNIEYIDDKKSKAINKQKQQDYCMKCNKKLKLTAIKCKCGNYYCNTHRHSDCHDCEFNYKDFGKKLLEKANPTILGEKVEKF